MMRQKIKNYLLQKNLAIRWEIVKSKILDTNKTLNKQDKAEKTLLALKI